MRNRSLQNCGDRKHWGSERGQALVETALVSPLLFLLLLGAAELARVAYAAIEVTNAARAAVQFAAQKPEIVWQKGGITNAAQADAYNINLSSGVTASLTPGYACTDGTAVTYDSGGAPLCATGSHWVQTATVTTSVAFDPLIHLPFLPDTIMLHGQATEDCLDN